MKSISTLLKNLMKARSTNLCRIWSLTLSNGTVYRFTDLDKDLPFNGNIYSCQPGIKITAIRNTADGGTQDATINLALSVLGISRDSVRRGVLDNGIFEVYELDYKTTSAGSMSLFKGKIADIMFTDRNFCEVDVGGLLGTDLLPIGETYTPYCRADFGDARCKFDLATVRKSFTVSIGGPSSFKSDDLPEVDANWDLGVVTWTSGNNNGITSEIRKHASGLLTFYLPPPFDIAPGDQGTIIPGCSKQRSMCRNRWSNLVNFRGEPDVPGQDIKAFRIPSGDV